MQKEIKKTKVILKSDGSAKVKTRTFKHKPLKRPFSKHKIKICWQYYWAEFVEASSFYDLEKCIWEKVDSSVVDYVYYDPDKRYFFVLFKSTREYAYCYLGVGTRVYMGFMDSESKGTYLSRNIKPDYKCLKFDFYREAEFIKNNNSVIDDMILSNSLIN